MALEQQPLEQQQYKMQISKIVSLKKGQCELDSHADTTVAGSNMIFLDDMNDATPTVEVSPFSDSYKPIKGVPVGTCATAYDCPTTGRVYILLFGQALYFGDKMSASLLCPNQIRANGNKVQDVPCQYDTDSPHGITFIDDETDEQLFIPLKMDGVISYLDSRQPTQAELEGKVTASHFWATSEQEWNPHSEQFAEDERLASKKRHQDEYADERLHRIKACARNRNISSIAIADDGLLLDRMLQKRMISESSAGDVLEPDLIEEVRECYRVSTVRDYGNNAAPESRSVCGLSIAGDNYYDKENTPETVTDDESSVESSDDGSERAEHPIAFNISKMKTGNIKLNAEQLSKRWGIGLQTAMKTLRVTTQKGLRKATHPVQKRFKRQPFHRKRIAPGKWFSDTTFFKKKSIINQNTAAQLTTNGKGFARFVPVKNKASASEGLVDLINNVGIPEHLITDGSKEQGSEATWRTNWMKVVKKYHMHQTWIEPYSWWQNAGEREIGEIKRDIKRFTQKEKSPRRLWAFLGTYVVGKRARTASTIPSNEGRTSFERVMGYTPDIGTYYAFKWYEWVYCLDPTDGETKLARWLGPAPEYGAGDCYWLLPISANPIVRSTVWSVPPDDFNTDVRKAEMKKFDEVIASKIGDDFGDGSETHVSDLLPDYGDLFADDDPVIIYNPEEAIPDSDEYTPDSYDNWLTAEVMLPIGDENVRGVVKRRVKDENGLPVGTSHQNPILDTREYEVQLPDGSVECYTANMIADNIYAQVDDEGNSYTLLDEIIDHRSNNKAVKMEDAWVHTKSGTRRRKPTTIGWDLLLQFKDGTTRWVRLADMKESFPIETAEYAIGNKIIEEPAFAWWGREVLRKRDRIICKTKTRYWKRSHKYGIELPKTIKEALQIDKRTKTNFWQKSLEKEMKNVMVAFEFTEDGGAPIGYEHLGYHMVFDVKITLDRKCRLVADGQRVEEQPREHTYSSVPSRDTVRMFFLLAALNDCDVMAADIQNAYLTAPITEKYWIKCGPEFGSNQGKTAKVVRALYGLPVAGAAFRSYLGSNLRTLGYAPMKADPDLWMRPAVKPDGTEYYEYLLAYVDDLCGMSMDTKHMFHSIGELFKLKKESVKEPDLYLGADIEKVQLPSEPGKTRWAMSSTNYTKKAIEEVERELTKVDKRLPTKVPTPLGGGYRPELDQTAELDAKRQNYYQGLIGVLRWICELGRLDILVAVSLMSRYLAQARVGQLEQVFHIFAYLKNHSRSKLVFDDTLPGVDERRFTECDWSEFYPDAAEAIPTDCPPEKGKPVLMYCFCDADHAGCKQTRRSHTGVIIFINRAPILWFSKRQNSVETSTFGSEIVALRIAIEMIEGLRYKLRMMGVPIDGACRMFCDNESVVKNTTRPESPLRKKSNSICYHKARESIAGGWIRLTKELGETNIADILTKLMPGPRLKKLVKMCMWR